MEKASLKSVHKYSPFPFKNLCELKILKFKFLCPFTTRHTSKVLLNYDFHEAKNAPMSTINYLYLKEI